MNEAQLMEAYFRGVLPIPSPIISHGVDVAVAVLVICLCPMLLVIVVNAIMGNKDDKK